MDFLKIIKEKPKATYLLMYSHGVLIIGAAMVRKDKNDYLI